MNVRVPCLGEEEGHVYVMWVRLMNSEHLHLGQQEAESEARLLSFEI